MDNLTSFLDEIEMRGFITKLLIEGQNNKLYM